jgi:hypothetical protein
MGSMSAYTCKQCEYSAMVCGGWEVGFVIIMAMMYCEGCEELVAATGTTAIRGCSSSRRNHARHAPRAD